jgi:hypothetical protein
MADIDATPEAPTPINIRIEPDLTAAIAVAAKHDSRPGARVKRSQMVRVLLWEALTARGIAPPQAL